MGEHIVYRGRHWRLGWERTANPFVVTVFARRATPLDIVVAAGWRFPWIRVERLPPQGDST